mmetsp:Transcript_24137/g.77906  ORF Transcript_24137/g.77906 Transcript_24137/m.77906 type:complete len:203 (+) Transcript_24137:204-812(+)
MHRRGSARPPAGVQYAHVSAARAFDGFDRAQPGRGVRGRPLHAHARRLRGAVAERGRRHGTARLRRGERARERGRDHRPGGHAARGAVDAPAARRPAERAVQGAHRPRSRGARPLRRLRVHALRPARRVALASAQGAGDCAWRGRSPPPPAERRARRAVGQESPRSGAGRLLCPAPRPGVLPRRGAARCRPLGERHAGWLYL